MSRLKQGIGVAIGALLASAGMPASSAMSAPPTAAPTTDQVQAPVPTIRWKACQAGSSWLCATVAVPLDYDQPKGATITLDLLKVPAPNQAGKLGTLFVNPGGPGGSSAGFAPAAAQLLGPTVNRRYDVIGIDPRGVGASAPMVCVNNNPVPRAPVIPFPTTVAESKIHFRYTEYLRSACTHNPAPVVRHMSTADTARDMDLIRQAVGDSKLTYYGISYGTQLGSTYASMFPSRVGRMVLDGVLDPVAWSTGGPANLPATEPFSTRIGSALGAHASITSALRECDRVGRRVCALAPGAAAKWQDLIAWSRAGTLMAGDQKIDYPILISGVLGYLYDHSYQPLADDLFELWSQHMRPGDLRAAESVRERLVAKAERVRRGPYLAPQARVAFSDAFTGVSCADTRNPDTREAWWNAGRAQDKRAPGFGSAWTWMSSTCAKYPISTKSDSWFGPYGGPTANPILVVGNTYDPATPIHGARKVASLFPSSRLLTYDGWGHGAIGTTCVTRAFDRFYATGALPAKGAVCGMDQGLFARAG